MGSGYSLRRLKAEEEGKKDCEQKTIVNGEVKDSKHIVERQNRPESPHMAIMKQK